MRLLLRHQTGSVLATALDFSVMIALVTMAGLSPASSTAIGAACGGVLNFMLGRHWIFRAHAEQGGAAPQALRYALVSFGSLLLNTGGEHVLATMSHWQFVIARIVVSFLVSILWNFPMQRSFVFRGTSLLRVSP
jgi:putative flippase GtrA